jgi:hypothetical protein
MRLLKLFGPKAKESGPLARSEEDSRRAAPREGVSSSRVLETDLTRSVLADNAGWRANDRRMCPENRPYEKSKSTRANALALTEDEDHVLRCLGAAAVMRWDTIPTKLRKELFDNASSIEDLLQDEELRGQIVRFLHEHKDDGSHGPGKAR